MSFQKAADLLRLAELATVRYAGVSLVEIEAEFRVDRRTAQRDPTFNLGASSCSQS